MISVNNLNVHYQLITSPWVHKQKYSNLFQIWLTFAKWLELKKTSMSEHAFHKYHNITFHYYLPRGKACGHLFYICPMGSSYEVHKGPSFEQT